jgi:hypothetical protein
MPIRSTAAKSVVAALLAAGLAVVLMVLLFPGKGSTAAPVSGPVVRLAAQFDMFNGEEFSTTNQPSDNAGGGQAIYEQSVFPPANANALFVTVSGTGDAHMISEAPTVGSQPQGQAKIMLACLVNNVPCNNGQSEANSETGWVTLQFPTDDLHDNGIYYTWCKSIPTNGAERHVTVKLGSSNGGTVYMETSHFFVDASQMPHGCQQAATPPDTGGTVGPNRNP